jgi:pimeloyl-ACP methyl ester carboxylesterase
MDIVKTWEASGTYLDVDGLSIWVRDVPATEDVGNDPLFVLHGFPTSAFDYHHVLDRLAAQRRVVLFDFVGFGYSDKPDVRYSLRLYADVAESVAKQLGLERVALLTHDMGNSVGGELLARDLEGSLPFEVSNRVITSGSIYIEMAQLTDGQLMLLSMNDERVDLSALGIDQGPAYKNGLAGIFSAEHPATDEELDAAWAIMSVKDGHQLLPRTIRYIEDRRAEERRFTGAIETHPSPLGIVWGDADPVAVYAMSDTLIAARPGTPRVTLEGVGHFAMLEAPDQFADAVLSFL